MKSISRRHMLKTAAGVAVGTFAGGLDALAQVTGVMPGGGTVPFRLPRGALTYLDPKQYLHNMEIHAFVPGPDVAGGEPLMNMWARGRQRFLPADGGWLDITEPTKPVFVKAGSFRLRKICVAYNTSLRKWIALESVEPPMPRHTPQYPRGQHHKEWVDKTTRAYTGLRGFRTYDITDPTRPILLQEYDVGRTGFGTHTNFYDGGKYAFLDCGWDDQLRMENPQRPSSNGIMIVDMTDPADVKEMSRWWVPGQRIGEEAEYDKYWFAGDESSWTGVHGAPTVPKRIEDGGKYGYGGFGAFGFYVFDFSDVRNPKPVGRMLYDFETIGGIPYHSVTPVFADAAHPRLSNLVLGCPETIYGDCREPFKTPYVIDVGNPQKPKVIGRFPRPQPPEGAPYADFCQARGRFGTHNVNAWVAPGTARPGVVAFAWFNAGLRLHDLSDPTEPRELAYFVPRRTGDMNDYMSWYRGTSENTFIEWDRNLIWLGTHEGTYCVSSPALGKPILEPRKIDKWTVPHCNAGWDDQTPTSVYFGRGERQVRG